MTRRTRFSPVLVVAGTLLLTPPLTARDDASDERFAPLADLAGHCWIGPFPGSEAHDHHCWEWTLGGKFLRDSHQVQGGESPYGGETLYGWDAEAGILRFWYFNTLGGVSTGTVERDGDRWLFREQYSGNAGIGQAGGQLEIRSYLVREDETSYDVVSEKRQEDGWREMFSMRLVRTDVRPAKTGGR